MATTSGFACMECGHEFRTVAAAERASFGPDGCPKCGSADIDLNDGPRGGEPRKAEPAPRTGEQEQRR